MFVLAVFLAAALGRIDRLVHGADDVGHADIAERTGEVIAAAGTAYAFDQFMAAQTAEQLLQIRQGYVLALADAGQRHRILAAAQRQIQHGRDCEATFGGQSHDLFS